ncbi:hypothetical protein [Halosolutus halophilus]|uniref:hypothetical protein n=1 Tax=Halosolutus halophilus TaxID=1552990 RepID=UPI002235043D|nr:hypothetical protein [Halosolutus halophilus]
MAPASNRGSDGDRSGQPIDPDRIVATIRAAPRPVVNTRYLANELDVPVDVLFDRLESMADDGRLETFEIRDRFHCWYLSLDEDLEA